MRQSSLLAGCVLLLAGCGGGGEFGRFVGTVKTEWVDPEREMKLLDDFGYVDPSGAEWKAPRGEIINGASIPQVLWTIVGSPFTGAYRNASVVHDAACHERKKPWQDVHLMFFNACRCGGVGEVKAKILYGAVYRFGPRWSPNGNLIAFHRTKPIEQEFQELKAFVEANNPSLQDIQRFEPPPATRPTLTTRPR